MAAASHRQRAMLALAAGASASRAARRWPNITGVPMAAVYTIRHITALSVLPCSCTRIATTGAWCCTCCSRAASVCTETHTPLLLRRRGRGRHARDEDDEDAELLQDEENDGSSNQVRAWLVGGRRRR